MRSLFSKFTLAIVLCSLAQPAIANKKLIDKILATINDQSITLSQVKRVRQNLQGRQEIAGVIYENIKSDKDVIDIFFQEYIIRKELEAIGYNVSEARVNAQIQNTLSRIGLNKAQLIGQLKKNGLTYDEYYHVIKQSIEFSTFQQRVIAPLVRISDQEIRSLYLQKSKEQAAQTVQYDIKDYIITTSKKNAIKTQERIQEALNAGKKVQVKNAEVIDLGKVKASGLNKKISNHIRSLKAGEVSPPLLIDGNYHIFHIKSISSSQTDLYEKIKPQIANYLFERKSRSITRNFFEQKIEENYDTKVL